MRRYREPAFIFLVSLYFGVSAAFAVPRYTPPSSSSPLTTKGDLYTYSTTNARLAAGTDGLCLKTNSAQATGLEWNTCSATSAYSTVQDEGSALTQRGTINFIGASVSCVDNAGSTRTDCTVSGGSGISYAEAVAASLAGF